jgi:hypothetical protein
LLLQNRDAFCDALITDMCRCARYKPSDVIGLAAAKRTAAAGVASVGFRVLALINGFVRASYQAAQARRAAIATPMALRINRQTDPA